MGKRLILGGTGFVGRAYARAWVRAAAAGLVPGGPLIVPSRRPSAARALATLPGVHVVAADVHDPAQLARLLDGADAVVNLVAILHGTPARFEQVHVELPRRLAEACARSGVHRLVHVSALGVDDAADARAAPSHYLRTKTLGERVLREAPGLATTVLRPSVIFGAEDRFIRLFARLQALAPAMALAGAQARFQPVWVEDVAQALVRCTADAATAGRIYECAGPEVLTLAELVRRAGRWAGHPRPVVPLPDWAGRLQAAMLGLLPGEPLMSGDNLDSMRVPNVATGRLPGLEALGVRASAIGAVMPPLLARGATADDLRRMRARRD